MKLNRRYKRNIKENLSFYISAIVLTVVTLFLFYIMNIAGNGINKFGDEFFERNKVEDAEFAAYTPIPDKDIPDLEQRFNIELEAQKYINLNEKGYTARVFSRTHKMDLYEITVGEDISSDGQIVISEGYAENMGVKIGSKIALRGKEYKVVGFFQRPDYLYMLEDPDDTYKNIDSFFLAYLSDNDTEKLGTMPVQYLIRYNTDNQQEVRKVLNDRYMLQSYLSADENMRITFVHDQADMFLIASYILLAVLPLVAVALICIIISRKVKSEQKMIGTLSALGYKKSILMLHYAGFAAIPGALGGVLSYVLALVFAQPYGEFGLADYEPMRAKFTLSPVFGIIGVAVPTIMYIIAALIAVRRLLKNDTVTLLNASSGSRKKLKRIFSKNKMSFRKKYALRSLIGNPGRSLVVLLGIFLGSFIMLFSFSIIDSVKAVSSDMISQTGTFEYEYLLNRLKTEAPDEGAPVLVAQFENKYGESIPVYGTDDDNPYLNLRNLNGKKINIESGYYVTNTTAYILNLKLNDSLELYNPLTMKKQTVKIDGIIDNDVQKGIFTSRQNAEGLTGLERGSYNALMSDTGLNIDNSEIAKTIRMSSLEDQCDTIIEQMGAIIYACVLIGVIICIASIYVAVNMMVTENRSNISMLKVLGYNDRRINSIVLNANHILLPIGIVFSIPFVYAVVNAFFRADMDMTGMLLKTHITLKSYIFTIFLTALSYFGSIFMIRRKIRKVDMVESLKDNRE